MKKIIAIAGVIVAIVGVSWLTSGDGGVDQTGPDLSAEVSNVVVNGEVIEVNLEQAAFDGPYLVVVKEGDGGEVILAIPSMGFQLCVAKDAIKHPSEIKAGMMVEASGALSSDGNVVPCESPNHYLKVVTE